ncbi:hypothetical protein [Hyphomonas sp.]|uniref:hypothetical protein n=1 Tax=Hyphomonas sp. TaxID=87 RepID=UPI0037C07F91
MSNERQLAKTGRALVFASLLGLLAGPALAQASGYDANCDPRNYTADEMLQQELCSAHVGCRLTQKAVTSACKVKDFFSSLGGVLGGRSTPDNLDVMEALNRTEVPQTSGVKKTNASARPYYEGSRLPSYDRTNAAQISVDPPVDGRPSGSFNRDKDGTVRWFEGTGARNKSSQLSGNGVQIESTGRIRAGILIDDAIGSGGVERAPDASWAGGNFKSGRLEGDGYQLKSDGTGNAPVLEGTFKNNQPDGMMLATYPDFSSRKELWKDGKLVVAGPKVAKGQVPPTPKTAEEEAAEKAAAEAAAFAAQLSSEKNPGALYALGDEWAEKGDMAKAKSAWRELIKRFPDSPLATQAAGRLSGTGSSAGGTSTVKPSSGYSGAACPAVPDRVYGSQGITVSKWMSTYSNYSVREPTNCELGLVQKAVDACEGPRLAFISAPQENPRDLEMQSYRNMFSTMGLILGNLREGQRIDFDAEAQSYVLAASRHRDGGVEVLAAAAELSACIYASLSGTTPPPVDSLTGEWRGEDTGNVVYMVQEANSILVSAVTRNAGQDPNSMRFVAAGPGKYAYTWPGGQQATVTVKSSNRIEVHQPTSSEVFVR